MEITKEAALAAAGLPTPEQLTAINRMSKSPLAAEQVYVFSLRLCDDQPDRDLERFDKAALEPLAEMFVGKTGILDHKWAADGQVARIFQAGVETEGEVHFIKAWAYIRRSERTAELIGDIEAGIKKEVSVGCAMGSTVCSICGQEYGTCGHVKGREYGGKTCYAILTEPKDAYEFSFVAVPAQRRAGVLKAKGIGEEASLKLLVEKQAGAAATAEFYRLTKEAALGRRFREQVQKEVLRLCLTLDVGLEEKTLRAAAEKLETEDLESLRKALEEKAARRLPLRTQLPRAQAEREEVESGFLI